MRFTIDDRVFTFFSDLQVAVLIVRAVENTGYHRKIQSLVSQEQEFARRVFSAVQLGEHLNIMNWRRAYQTFGSTSGYRSSIEALVRRSIKGQRLPRINKLVDLYNLVSLKYLVPIGGEDLAAVRGDLRLTVARGDEPFLPLGEEKEDRPSAGEVVYEDDGGCITRRFNWREAERTKLTEQTRNAFFSIEGLPPVDDIDVKEASYALERLVVEYCGGHIETLLLNRRIPSITFTP